MDHRQTWRHHLATFQRVMVTPARLFGLLTTLTFGARRSNHIVSVALETIAKKQLRNKESSLSTCDHQFCHELSRTQPKSEGKCVSVGVDEDFPICLVSLDTNCSSTPQYTCTTALNHGLPDPPPPEVTSMTHAASAGNEMCFAR